MLPVHDTTEALKQINIYCIAFLFCFHFNLL